MSKDTLTHYGVLGMKWGVRRTPEQLARARGAVNESGKIAKELRGLSGKFGRRPSKKTRSEISQMSDEELKRRVTRMNLERSYASLSGDSISKGRERFDRMLDVTAGVLAIASSSIAIKMALKAAKNK